MSWPHRCWQLASGSHGVERRDEYALWQCGYPAFWHTCSSSWVQSILDRHSGALGKFYLFRPSSLILLFGCCWCWRPRWEWKPGMDLRGSLLAAIGPFFLYTQGGELARTIAASEALEHEKRTLVSAMTRVVG